MKIAIVNDLKMAVEILKRLVLSVSEYEIAWIAENGAEAVKKCAEDVPNLILMDLIMPVMDGVEATRRIMKNSPCSILVVTATVEGNMSKVFEVMGYGALDAVATPVIGSNGNVEGANALLAKIATIGKLIGKTSKEELKIEQHKQISVETQIPNLVAMGSSTGGPKALVDILSQLPKNFNASIAIVQHVDVRFAEGLVEWLDRQTHFKVSLVKDNMSLKPGRVFVAGTNDHLIITPDLTFAYTSEPGDLSYRPSVNIFFKSLALNWHKKAAAVLLTGMGTDGAEGLKALRRAGWYTISQDKDSSVVYGMPKAAAALGAAVDILPLEEIAPALVRYFNKKIKKSR